MTGTTETTELVLVPPARRLGLRYAAVGAALATAAAAATVVLLTGGGSSAAGCTAAIRSLLAQATAGVDLTHAERPRACRGFTDDEMTSMAGGIVGDRIEGILGAAFAGLGDSAAPATDATVAPAAPELSARETCRADLADQLAGAAGSGTYSVTKRAACAGVSDAAVQAMAREIITAQS